VKRLVAKFDIELPFFFVIKRAEDDDLRYGTEMDGFDVEILLKPYDHGPKSKNGDDEHWSFYVSGMHISVSREESLEVPPIRTAEEGGQDFSLRAPYFRERLPKYREIAVKAANRAIRFFKYRLHNPLLHEISSREQDFQNPKWVDEVGQEYQTGMMSFIARMAPGLGFPEFGIKKFTPAEDSELQKALQNDVTTELQEELLSDAQAAIFQNNLRRGILEMAIGCEVAIKQTFFQKSTVAGSVYEYLEDKRRINVSVIDLLDGVAKQAFGESFKDADEAAFRNIDFLFRCRNKVAHRGEITYKDDEGVSHAVSKDTLREWWKSVEILLDWLGKHRT